MILKSFKLALANKGLCLKTLLCRFIVYLACFIPCYYIISASLTFIFESKEFGTLLNSIWSYIDAIFHITSITDIKAEGISAQINTAVYNLFSFIGSNMSGIITSLIAVILIIQALKFLIGVFDYVIGVLANEHMSSLNHAPLFSTLFENFKSAVSFGLFRTLMSLAYNLVLGVIVYLLSILFIYLLGLLAVPVIVLMFILMVSIRQSFAGLTLAKMICEKKGALKSFKEVCDYNFKNINTTAFRSRFVNYFVLCVLALSITVALAISSFLVSLIVTIPLFSVMFIVIKLVDYYDINAKRYYITYDEIIVPKELRKGGEILLNKVDI